MLSEGLRELGSLYYAGGDLTTAERLTKEALMEARAIGSMFGAFLALYQLVIISCLQNDLPRAKGYCFELWAIARDTGALFAAWFVLLAFGLAASFGGEPQRGVRLIAAFEVLSRQYGLTLGENEPVMIVVRQALERARTQLGPAAFEAAQQEGRTLTPELAIALATEDESKDLQPPGIDSESSSD